MITQVVGPNVGNVAKDPRKKSQRVQFKHNSSVPYSQYYSSYSNNGYRQDENNAMRTSIFIAIGAVLFTTGYFLLSSLKTAKPLR